MATLDFPTGQVNGYIHTHEGKQWEYVSADSKWVAYGASLAPDVLKVDAANNRVGINQTSPAYGLDVTGTARVTGLITASGGITGTASLASLATEVTVSANNSTNETVYPTFVDGATSTQGIETDTGLTYNPSTGTLTSTIFAGAATTAGTVTTAAQGAITSVGTLSVLAVTGAVTAGSVVAPIQIPTAKTASYTLVIGDAGKLIEMNVGSTNTLTIPTNTVDFDVGTQIVIVQLGAGATTIAGAGSVAIYSKDSNKVIDGQYSAATLIKRADTGDGQWHLIGALTS